jgi:hypothetical protein
MESKVYKVLSNDSVLDNLLGRTGNEKIYNSPVAPIAGEFPRITIFYSGEDDNDGADNKTVYTEHYVRVDLWHNKNNLREIKNKVRELLKASIIDCDVEVGGLIYEPDTKIYHIPIDVIIYEG